MPRLMRKTLVLVLALAACGRSIGDDCETNVQCSPQGDRQCDLSQPGGYCTVEGCDRTSCPDNAVCVRFFAIEGFGPDCSCSAPMAMCGGGALFDPSRCSQRDICLPQEQRCVNPLVEHRFCMKPCDSDSDCRDGYECRQSGADGAELLPKDDLGNVDTRKFCIERPVGGTVDAGPRVDANYPDAPEGDAMELDGGTD